MRCPAPPCSVTKYRGSRCNTDAMRNVSKKLFDAAVAIEEPKRFPYPPSSWPYPSSEFCAWPIPAPKAELRKREGATLKGYGQELGGYGKRFGSSMATAA